MNNRRLILPSLPQSRQCGRNWAPEYHVSERLSRLTSQTCRRSLSPFWRPERLRQFQSDDHVDLLGYKLVSKCHEPRRLAIGVTLVQLEISALDVPECPLNSRRLTRSPRQRERGAWAIFPVQATSRSSC